MGKTKKILMVIFVFALGFSSSYLMRGVISSPEVKNEIRKNPQNISNIANKKVRIGSFSTAIDYAPYLVARSKGMFESALAKFEQTVEFVTFQSLPSINESFATDNIDIVFEAAPPAIIANSAGIDVKIAAVGASLIQEIVVPIESEINSVGDLTDKNLAVLAGTSSHYGLLNALTYAGVDSKNVNIIDMVPPDAKAAFKNRTIDAWAIWPPFVEQEIVDRSGKIISGGDVKIHSIMAVRGGFIGTNPEAYEAVLRVLLESKIWISQNQDEAINIISKELDLSREVVELSWNKHNWLANLTPEVASDIQKKTNFLVEQGLIKNEVNVEEVIVLK